MMPRQEEDVNTREPASWVDQDGRAAIIDAVLDALNPSQGRLNMARAWIDQDAKQVKKHGKAKASYYVNWYDPDGRPREKSCGPGPEGLRLARKLKRQVEAELLTGTYNSNLKKAWGDFRVQYESQILAGKSAHTQRQARMSLSNFERIVNPKLVSAVKTATIDQFIAKRRVEPKRYNADEPVSTASVNADLRNLKAALTVAHEWGFVEAIPRFRFVKGVVGLPTYVIPEHFVSIYQACDAAGLPEAQGYTAGDWWRAFLVMAYVATGLRVGQLLDLRREDLNLDAGAVVVRGDVAGNKGKRERLLRLHPVAVAHLRKLVGFAERVFPWPHDVRTITSVFARVQKAAGIHLPCHKDHKHKPACHRYSPHDLRRGFGTLNAPRLTMAELQHWMDHKSPATTMGHYVNPAAWQEESMGRLFVPPGLEQTG